MGDVQFRPAVAEVEPLAVDVPTAAKMLSISDDLVRVMIRKGSLPAVRLGHRRTIICVSDLKDFIASKRSVTD